MTQKSKREFIVSSMLIPLSKLLGHLRDFRVKEIYSKYFNDDQIELWSRWLTFDIFIDSEVVSKTP